MSPRALLHLAAAVALLLPLGGCLRGCTSSRPPIHPNPNMDVQPKYRAQAASDFFYDGAAMRLPVAGTVARGELGADGAFATGKDAAGAWVANPLAAEDDQAAVLRRGEERYGIYCSPCHGGSGNGRGMLYQRSQVESADLREARLRAMPDGQIFDTITNGFGLMQGYRYPVPARDRWAIVAWMRELQAEAAELDATRAALAAEGAAEAEVVANEAAAAADPAAGEATAPPADAPEPDEVDATDSSAEGVAVPGREDGR